MIKVLFFAQIREIVGTSSLMLDGQFATIEEIRCHLISKGDKWALALESGHLLVAANQILSPFTTPVTNGDEIAFFPPVTGG